MKRYITPSLLFIACFVVTLFRQRYSLIEVENLGIFLATPDYFREVIHGPWPVSTLIADFIIQFFRYTYVAQAIFSALIVLVFLLARSIAEKFFPAGDIFGAVAACILWFIIARTLSIATAIASILIGTVILLLLLWKRGTPETGKRGIMVASALIFAASALIVSNKTVRMNERWAKVEYSSIYHHWDAVLEAATVRATEEDRDMLPYALMALNGKGQLSSNMMKYPISGPQDLDMEGVNSRRGYLFTSILYECLGCPNEALHQAFQSSCFLPHGTSFRSLRQLVALNYQAGNHILVQKYCDILRRSSCHKEFIKAYEELVENQDSSAIVMTDNAAGAALITHNPEFNIYSMRNAGIASDMALDRFRAYMSLQHSGDSAIRTDLIQ